MLQHTLILIYRNILRFPGTFLINVFGLSTGLTCSLLIYLWIADEMSFDKFHENEARIYQVMENQKNSGGFVSREATPFGLAYVIGETLPEVEYAATVTPTAWFPKFGLESRSGRVKGEGRFVGKDFFRIFSFDLIQGNKEDVLADAGSVVISEALAVKLFGKADGAVGKAIPWDMSTIKKESVVTGVFKDLPSNSSEQFDLVFNIDLLGQIMNFQKDDLGAPGPSTFVMLKEGSDAGSFNRKVSELMSQRTGNKQADFFVSRFSEKYLYGQGRIEYVKLFGVIGVIILVVAAINFMNLSTARASRRMKEVGVKKAVGAWRSSLITQFFTESMLISFASMFVALAVGALILPLFNDVTGKQIVLALTGERILGILVITLTTGILAGIYPALHLSGFKPGQILKGRIVASYSETVVRKALVIFQFAVSIVFILSVLVIHKQMSFIQSKNLGFDRDNVLYFEIEGGVSERKDAFIEATRNIPGVVNASAMVGSVIGAFGGPQDMSFEGKTIPIHRLPADYGMIETLGIPMESGRTFSKEFNEAGKIVINAAAIEQLGITDPVGKTVDFQGGKFEIIGVTGNFHGSLYEKISPMAFMLETNQLLNVFVKLDGSAQVEALKKLEALYKTFNPGFVFDYQFLDAAYQSQYKGEQQVASLSLWFSVLAVIISCLGLLGLSAFTVEKRVKEIGIRKVLGASPASIAYILSFEFVKMVLVAIAVALPVSFFVINEWLHRFAYAVDLELWFFAATGVIAVLIAVATVGGQSIRASFANPTDCLKEE